MNKYMVLWIMATVALVVVNLLYAFGIGANHQIAGTVCGAWYMYFGYKFMKTYEYDTATE